MNYYNIKLLIKSKLKLIIRNENTRDWLRRKYIFFKFCLNFVKCIETLNARLVNIERLNAYTLDCIKHTVDIRNAPKATGKMRNAQLIYI